VVTPGTLTDTELLNDKSESILLAVHNGGRGRRGLAWLAVTQGELHLAECPVGELAAWVERIGPSELLVAADLASADEQALQAARAGSRRAPALTRRPEWQFDADLGRRKLLEQLGAASLAAWNAEELPQAHAAAAALLAYAEHTQGRALTHVRGLRVARPGEAIDLPATTRRNLELVQTLRGEDSPTLFSLLDTCQTGMGSRLLKSWLLAPPRDRDVARERLGAIGALQQGEAWQRLRARLKGTSDVERITARLALAQVRPRELVALRHSLQKKELPALFQQALEPLLAQISGDLSPPAEALDLLQAALLEEPAALIRDGGVIAPGLDEELDELRAI